MPLGLRKAVLLIATAIACNSSTEPGADGQYLLESVNDRALPTSLDQDVTVTSGSLTFNDDGTALLVFRLRNDQPFSAYTSSHVWYYTRNGTDVHLLSSASCPTIMSCDELNGSIDGSTLILGSNSQTPTLLRYRENVF